MLRLLPWLAVLSLSWLGCRLELPDIAPPGRDAAADGPPDGPDAAVDGPGPRSWVTAQPPHNPGRLYSPKLTYWAAASSVLLYGGRDPADTLSADTWVYDGQDWQKLCGPCPPGPRLGHGLVLDQTRGVIVLFGGQTSTGASNEIWEISGGVWQKATPTGTPPSARIGVYTAFDPVRGRTVVFGGMAGTVRLDDVHEYDGAAWHGPFTPSPRPAARRSYGNTATFVDATGLSAAMRDRVVVCGGEVGIDTMTDDCWAWDGAAWTELCAACTGTARGSAGLGFDPVSGRLVMVSGWSGSASIGGTLEHDGTSWSQVTDQPTERDNAGLAFDPGRGRFVLYGGNGCGGRCDETLEY